jgi:hypothetical protein
MPNDQDTITYAELRGRLYDLCESSRDGVVTYHSAGGTKGLAEHLFRGTSQAGNTYTRGEIARAITQLGGCHPHNDIQKLIAEMEKNREPDVFLPERVYRHKYTGIYLFRTQKREWQVFGLPQTVQGGLYKPEVLELMP